MRRRRIDFQAPGIDGFLALEAIAILAGVETAQCRRDALQVDLPPAPRFDRHRLRLYGVHPGKTANPRLVEFDRRRCLVTGISRILEFLAPGQEPASEPREIPIRHGQRRLPGRAGRGRISDDAA